MPGSCLGVAWITRFGLARVPGGLSASAERGSRAGQLSGAPDSVAAAQIRPRRQDSQEHLDARLLANL